MSTSMAKKIKEKKKKGEHCISCFHDSRIIVFNKPIVLLNI